MYCPKCKAKVGMMREKLYVQTGAVQSVKCCICGYWTQVPLPALIKTG